MADIYTKAKRSKIMSSINHRRTGPEEKVAALLQDLGARFDRNVKGMPGEPDFVVKSAKTAIFVNGCFWHGHSGCKRASLPKTNRAYWKRKIERNRKRDCRTARMLRRRQWHVITVWQCRLRNPNHVLNRLRRMLIHS